ncbi:MAG: WecB/TagA/CpsF family glycosyltransferase [Pseudomonadota bacterium]
MGGKDMSESVLIGGLNVDKVSRDSLADELIADVDRDLERPRLVFSVNGQGISMAATDPEFLDNIRKGDLRHADGMSVVFASRLLTRTPLPERVATTDFFHDAARAGEPKGLKFFFLGASEDVVRRAYYAAKDQYPEIEWVGFRDGYFSEDEEADVCRELVESGADVVWVGLGRPKQEAFCVRNAHRLQGITWMKTCGGLFDFLAGNNPRAPQWMQSLGLEWLFRTMQEPRRLLRRYIVTNAHAVWLFLTRSGRVARRLEP